MPYLYNRPGWGTALLTAVPLALLTLPAQAQVGLGTATPNANAALDITATGKGLLIPRMDSATRAQISSPPDGLMVFQTNGRTGFWYAIGGAWVFIPDKARAGDNLGNHTASQALRLNNQWLSNDGGAEGVRVDNNGRVGVGVAAPTAALHVAASNSIDALRLVSPLAGPHMTLQLPDPANGQAIIDYIGAGLGGSRSGALELRGNNSVQISGDLDVTAPDVYVAADGRVGVGTTAPAARLDVQAAPRIGTHPTNLPFYATGNVGEASNGFEFRHTNGTQGIGLGYNTVYATGTNPNQSLNLAPRGDAGIGIGTLAPQGRLHFVNDNRGGGSMDDYLFDEYGPGDQALYLRRANGTAGAPTNLAADDYIGGLTFVPRFSNALGYAGSAVRSHYAGDGTTLLTDLRLVTSNAERVRITDGGRVGVGTSSPAYPLDVAGDLNTSTMLRVGGLPMAYYRNLNTYFGTLDYAAAAPTGQANTLVGRNAGLALTSGGNNTAVGYLAGDALTTGGSNAFLGIQAGGNTTTGSDNVYIGHDPGFTNVSGSNNIGVGFVALYNATSSDNTAIGNQAGSNVTTGAQNTFLGAGATLSSATQRNRATAIGYLARVDQDDAVVLGDPANTATRVGIGTATPAERLDVNGNARVGAPNTPGKVLTRTTGTANMLPVAYGQLGGPVGNTYSTSGNYTCTRTGVGVYVITFPSSSGLSGYNFDLAPVLVSVYGSAPRLINWVGGTGNITVRTYNLAGTAADVFFTFTAYAP